MSHSLTQRLQSLAEAYKKTLALIQELYSIGSGSPPYPPDSDEKRIELGNEIHDSLKEQDDTLELLRQEIDDDAGWTGGHRGRYERDTDHERNADLVARLSEDLRGARAKFRRAQLQAKRNLDNAKRKEAESLFAGRTDDSNPSARKKGQEKLTQDELALNASQDVTRALRRAHDLLQGNLQQSQFAQQTLDESQDALKGLADSYGGTGDLLKNSRGLVTQLVRSNKSDTWFLLTSFYVLAVTLAWLVFRRLLYGPLWWLVWKPFTLVWWLTLTSLGSMGLGMSRAQTSVVLSDAGTFSASSNFQSFPTNPAGMPIRSVMLPNKGGPAPAQPPQGDNMVDKIGHMMDANRAADETGAWHAERNTKKRMFEADDVDAKPRRDEL